MNFDRSIDPHRPLYHFSPPLGWWGGGPDGTIHHDGQYHVFYQFDPYMGSTSGNASWGHAVSRDLVHWEHRPVAIGPTPFGADHYAAFARSDLVRNLDRSGIPPILYDREVCFSGSAVIDRGVPTLVYTGILHGLQDAPVMLGRSQCIATSDDGMLTWRKHPANPVIPHPPPELVDPSQRPEAPVWSEGVLPSPRRWLEQGGQDRAIDGSRLDAVEEDETRGQLTAWHDPHVWREGETWYMGLGCGFLGVGGAVLLYRSPDLVSWEYMHPLCVGTDPEYNRWLVPDFFALGDRHVLLAAATSRGRSGKAVYMVGEYRGHRFTPESEGFLDTHPMACFHCARTLLDPAGRRIVFGVLAERRLVAGNPHGWAGVLSLPRVLELGEGDRLLMDPVPEVCSSGEPDWELAGEELAPDRPLALAPVQGDCLEMVAEIDPGSAREVGLQLRRSPGGEEETAVRYDRGEAVLGVDTTKSSLEPDTGRTVSAAPLDLKPGEPLRLHLFLDRSTLEVFANRRTCASDRLYPAREDSLGAGLFALGGRARLESLKVWRRSSIFFPRE